MDTLNEEMLAYLHKGCTDDDDWNNMLSYVSKVGLKQAYDIIHALFRDNWSPVEGRDEKLISNNLIRILKQYGNVVISTELYDLLGEACLKSYCRNIEHLEVDINIEHHEVDSKFNPGVYYLKHKTVERTIILILNEDVT